MLNDELQHSLKKNLEFIKICMDTNSSFILSGMITKISGMKIEASGLSVPIGTICRISLSPQQIIEAEVIGFSGELTYLMACDDISGIKPGTPVISLSDKKLIGVGSALLGRVMDSNGKPIDGGQLIHTEDYYPLACKPINPLLRQRISQPLDVGIRAINAITTIGKGQRLGIFAGSGVGKSVLLGMMTKYTKADVVIVGLIGERGREVKEFIEEYLGETGRQHAVVVAAPSDTSPLQRVNAASLAATIAEYFREQGKDVLLIIDSLTRYAQSMREIALSAGELPTTKGYTPSVFAKMAQYLERSGPGIPGQGSITGLYTVLVEGDDHNDPIADHARSLLDGHIVLTRELADQGLYPAIDIERSISRVMPMVTSQQHLNTCNQFKKLYSTYQKNRDLINVGMYQPGSDILIDQSLQYKDFYEPFLRQEMHESSTLEESIEKLISMTGLP
jgi:flagellum-specific ATP synthase